MKTLTRLLLTLAAIVGIGAGLAPASPVDAVASGCSSTRISGTMARGYCTTLTSPSRIREVAQCRYLSSGNVVDRYGPLVSSGGSIAQCPYGSAVANHYVIVYQS